MRAIWEFHKKQRKMPLTTNIFNNVLQSSGFSEAERLVREALQNSVDAHLPNSDVPVSVRFEKKILTGDRKKRLVAALALDTEPKERRKLFDLPAENALGDIDDPSVPLSVLEISDFHTCGLGGEWDGTSDGDHFGRLVVNLGVDDKAEGTDISGGSFGFGKTVYGKASRIGVVVFYSVFEPTKKSGAENARFMATGLFKPHQHKKISYDGFAFCGAPDPNSPEEVIPLTGDDAHHAAAKCGLDIRTRTDYGTSILILDCDPDMEALKCAAEIYWWPRLIKQNMEVVFIDDGSELWPRPKQNNHVAPFIECYQNVISEREEPPRSKIFRFNRVTTADGPKSLGILSCMLQEAETRYSNSVALLRAPQMVVNYRNVGSDSFEACVGVFVADPDVEKMLTYAEPQMHDQWDAHSDRLKKKFGADGQKVVATVSARIERLFKEFQRMQEPPIPPGGLQPRELSKLLGRFLENDGGIASPPPPPSGPRPVEIHVNEDRVLNDGIILDIANIALELRPDYEVDELDCILNVHHELLGDTSQRIVARSECELVIEDGTVLAKGAPASARIALKKGYRFNVCARAPADYESVARVRISVEEAP